MNTWDQKRCNAANRYWIVILTLFALAALPGSLTPAYCAAPANDNFENAIAITSLPFSNTVNNEEAGIEDGEPQCCFPPIRTVWYSFTPDADVVLRADTLGSSVYNPILTVMEALGPDLSALSCLSCGFYDNTVTFRAWAGTTYYIRLGSTYDEGGYVQLNLTEVPPPANDNFADAAVITELPFEEAQDVVAATLEEGEPAPGDCGAPVGTIWYVFTPDVDGPISARVEAPFWGSIVAYTGNTMDNLEEIKCRGSYDTLTFTATAGVTYYFQIGGLDSGMQGFCTFILTVAPPPVASISAGPWDPSIFDVVSFYNSSYDPGGLGIQSQSWDFGDGATSADPRPTHQYAADGDYTVSLTVWTTDGRTASTTAVMHVRTHDVAITKFAVPSAAASKQTRTITVGINSKRYPENVTVQLMKSVPGYGYLPIGSLTQSVPVRSANRTTVFSFNYTFTSEDARMRKVTFRAVADIAGARDALPGDNEAIALPTKVSR